MRILELVVLLSVVFGCSESSFERTNQQVEIIELMIASTKLEINEFIEGTGIESKPLDQVSFIDSLYSSYSNLIDNWQKEDVKAAFESWNDKVIKVFSSESRLIFNENSSSIHNKLELSIKTLKVLSDLNSSLKMSEDMVFDQIEVLFVPQISELKLGQSFEGEVYLGALMKNNTDFVDFYYNGKKLNKSKRGGGLISFEAKKIGSQIISVVAQVAGPNDQPFEFKSEMTVVVK